MITIRATPLLRTLFLYIIVISTTSCSFTEHDPAISSEIVQLLDLTGIKCDHTLTAVVEETQKHWLRKGERWEIEENLSPESSAAIFEICSSLGYFHEILPQRTKYDYCCIHGGTMANMITRLEFAAQLEAQGIEIGTYVLLTGNRPLGAVDKTELFPVLPANETDGMKLIYSSLPSLENMRKKPVIIIQAPQIETAPGVFARPSTHHTVLVWLLSGPKGTTCLFISNQPFCLYQHEVCLVEMPSSFTIETVGPRASASYQQRPLLLLDTVARTLYQTLKNREKTATNTCMK